MTSASFDFAPLLPAGLPVPAARWTGLAKYSFVGGNNDPEQVPLDGLIEAVSVVASASFRRPPLGRGAAGMRLARTCYDHIAGILGVAIADRLQAEKHVVIADGGGMVTASGERFLAALGVAEELSCGTRRIWHPCRVRLSSSDGASITLHPAAYQFEVTPATADEHDWDANWLMIHGDVRIAGGRQWAFLDPCLTT